MRNLIAVLVVLFFVGLGGFLLYRQKSAPPSTPTPILSQSPSSSSRVLFPQGGESLVKGETYTLKWSGGGGSTVQIFLVDKDLESQGESAATVDKKFNIQNSGSYSYKIPQSVPDGSYKFEIGSLNSNDFRIVSPTTTASFCNPNNLKASLTLSPGAGNVYGTFTLKNISQNPCRIMGGGFIDVQYPTSVKNLSVTHVNQTQTEPFNLSPNQTLYSQVHYPNGPQCQGPTVPVNVTFSYKISPTDSVTFRNQGQNPSVVQSCSSVSEKTQIQIWEMSTKPIVPNP